MYFLEVLPDELALVLEDKVKSFFAAWHLLFSMHLFAVVDALRLYAIVIRPTLQFCPEVWQWFFLTNLPHLGRPLYFPQ